MKREMTRESAVTMSETSRSARSGDEWVNVSPTERAVTGLVGGVMLGWGVRRGRAGGALAALFGSMLLGRSMSGHCPVYAMPEAGEDREARSRIAREKGWKSASVVTRSVTVSRPRHEVYAFWRDFSNLPRFMDDVESVEVLSPDRSRWTVKGPAGSSVRWVSRVTEDRPDRIAWEAEEEADVRNAGSVEFRELPDGHGTEVRATIAYEPPAGHLGKTVARLFGREPGSQAARYLHDLKRLLEEGETVPAASGAGAETLSGGTTGDAHRRDVGADGSFGDLTGGMTDGGGAAGRPRAGRAGEQSGKDAERS